MRAAILALALSACAANVDAPAAELSCSDDVAVCAVAHFEAVMGPLGDRCSAVVLSTQVNYVPSAEIAAACPQARAAVLGCMTAYSPDGAVVQVANTSERQLTAVHELTHVALRCARGNADAAHTAYGALWVGL